MGAQIEQEVLHIMVLAIKFVHVLQFLLKHRLLPLQDTLHLLLTALFIFAGRVSDLGRQSDDSDEAAACHYDLTQLVVLTDALTGDGADIQEGNHNGCDQNDMTLSWAPGNAFLNNNWTYLDPLWLCGGDITPETAISYAKTKGKVMVLDRVTKSVTGLAVTDGTSVEDMTKQDVTRRGGSTSTNPGEVRFGKRNDTMYKGDIYGAAVGFGAHLTNGVFCGLDDLEGKTSIEGLWVSGDGMMACGPTGAAYPTGVGFTSNFVSTMGNRAGKAPANMRSP